VEAKSREFQLAREGATIERLDVDQFMLEPEGTGRKSFLGQPIEHERVVGVGTVTHTNQRLFHLLCHDLLPQFHCHSKIWSGWLSQPQSLVDSCFR